MVPPRAARRLSLLAAHTVAQQQQQQQRRRRSEPMTPWLENLLVITADAGPLARGRRFDTNGGPGHRLPGPGEVVPLKLGSDLCALPSELQRVRSALEEAEAAGLQYEAAVLRDLLHVVEPKPELSPADCAPDTVAGCVEFFRREGFVCVPGALRGESLRQVQEAFHRVQAPAWQRWEAVKQQTEPALGNFGGEDFTPDPAVAGELGGYGRLFFDLNQELFWRERAFAAVVAPPKLAPIVRALCGEDARFTGIQPRTVPGPENDGGYVRAITTLCCVFSVQIVLKFLSLTTAALFHAVLLAPRLRWTVARRRPRATAATSANPEMLPSHHRRGPRPGSHVSATGQPPHPLGA